MLVKLDHFPRDRGENNKYLKPPRSYTTLKLTITRFISKVFVLRLGFCSHNSTWGLSKHLFCNITAQTESSKYTLQGINISHLGEKENHLQNAIFGGYVSSLEGILWHAIRPEQIFSNHGSWDPPHLTIEKASYELGQGMRNHRAGGTKTPTCCNNY